MSKNLDPTYVYCIKCPENKRIGDKIEKKSKNEIEKSQWNSWVCTKCSDKVIGLKLIDFIKTRIQVTEPEDNRSRFIFRELIQNADDKKAKILVLRFEEDALYVANDGKAFTTGLNGDFDKISKILGRHQAEDKEATGHFGSGFQTVYAITNSPEVHSSGQSRRMNPYTNEWDDNYVDLFIERKSPYINNLDQKGVLFRFPWRDNKAAQETIRGEKVWEDSAYWHKWNEKERKELFEDLKNYILHAMICCRYLKTIRLIWHTKNLDKLDYHAGFQAQRNFCLNRDDKSTCRRYYKGAIVQGIIVPHKWTNQYKWNDSFQLDKWLWEKNPKTFEYLIGEDTVGENGKEIFLVKKPDNIITVISSPEPKDKILKRGDIFLLFPLFEIKSDPTTVKGAYLYSVIPLPTRGKNQFIFSGHFQPAEDRKDVDVEGQNGVYGIWYQNVMTSILQLYEWLFTVLLDQIQSRRILLENDQEILLNALPGVTFSEWMRPGRENRKGWSLKSEELFDRLLFSLCEKPIIHSNKKWIKPSTAYWASTDLERKVFEIMGYNVYPTQFTEHLYFKNTLSKKLEQRIIDIAKFNFCWTQFFDLNKNQENNLVYYQKLHNGEELNKETVENLIEFCLFNPKIGYQNKPVIPGKDGVLRTIKEYPLLSEDFQFLFETLPGSNSINEDFKTFDLLNKHAEHNEYRTEDQIIYLINDLVKSHPAILENLSGSQHYAFSKVIKKLANSGWGPREGLIDCKFIPFKLGNAISIGTLNARRTFQGREWISGQHIERNYERNSIFGAQSSPVPGLTPEVESKVRFLSLVNCDKEEITKIEKMLCIIKLMAVRDNPSNFVRHFLSSQNGSLFEDRILMEFIGTVDSEQIVRQKKQFLQALKVYFKSETKGERFLQKEDMGKVPCLYDEKEQWHSAEKFVLHLKSELGVLGYKSLNHDFEDWSNETLLALGVADSPKCSTVIDTIKNLSKKKEQNRKELEEIISWLLTSSMKIGSEFREDIELSTLSWVPTIDGSFNNPAEILISTPDNKAKLGEDFEDLLDLSLCKDVIEDTELMKEATKTRAESLGFKTKPPLQKMLKVLIDKRASNERPPKNLFDAIDESLRYNPDRSKRIMTRRYGYYKDGKWIDSTQIKIMDNSNIPQELRNILEIVPNNSPHTAYLIEDGAGESLYPKDILNPIAKKKIIPTLELWDKLRDLISEDSEIGKETYGKLEIYPINGKLISPRKIIFEENETLTEGAIGNFYIIENALSQRHGKILKALGAMNANELTRLEIIEILINQKYTTKNPDENTVFKVLQLIKKLHAFSSEPFPNQQLWPAELGGEFVWRKPAECYIKDTSSVPQEFLNKIGFLALRLDQKAVPDRELKNYAIQSGAQSFIESLKKHGGIECTEETSDEYSSAFFNTLSNALNQCFDSEYQKWFSWLRGVKVRNCNKISVSYLLDGIKAKMNKAAVIEKEDPICTISTAIREQKELVYKQLSEEIADVSLSNEFPEASLEDLRNILYKLLSNEISVWSIFVTDYVPNCDEVTISNPLKRIENQNGKHSFDNLSEIFAENIIEMAETGYNQTKDQLSMWYNSCQICGRQTPGDENGYGTYETLKRVVCRRGGRYQGDIKNFNVDNSLLLCPTHQVLWVRKLVKFPELEKPTTQLKKRLREQIEELDKGNIEDDKDIPFDCEVFEGKRDLKTGKVKREWTRKPITFKSEHFKGFLKTLVNYLEKEGY